MDPAAAEDLGALLRGALTRSLRRRDHATLDETAAIAALIGATPGVMIDVGAHHGTALAHFATRGWTVHAYEPDPENRAVLEGGWGRHAAVTIDPRAVSDTAGEELQLYRSDVSTGISGLHAFHASHEPSTVVTTTTLADVYRDHDLAAVDFLKIDTEGHDLLVLEGMDWDRDRPRVIECEFEDTKTVPIGYDAHDLARFLVGLGYTVWVSEWHPVLRYGTAHDWRGLSAYPCRLTRGAWGNFLAFREPTDLRTVMTGVAASLRRHRRD